ncbi:MAG: hypothetical protein Q8O67_01825 [Deltaproteobacteria bacterium]|nr:hypothetical protein [Deltaproteobacteria bacterium]
MERYLGVDAGPFRLALPLGSVRQILDVGQGDATLDPRALGVMPHSLAELLGEAPTSTRPAVLLFDGTDDPVVLTCCRLRGVVDAPRPRPLPQTVACRWPGLLQGTVDGDDGLILVLDSRVLMGLVEAQS